MSTRTYTQTARAEATERTRTAIMEAAVSLFLEEGLFDPPLDRVAERAEVTTRTILRHFGSKEGLTAAAVRRSNDQVADDRAAAPGDVETAVHKLVAHYERWGDPTFRLLAEAERNPTLRAITEAGTATHLAWVDDVFAPFLDGVPVAVRRHRRALLASVCDLYTWALLRRRHGFDQAATEAAIRGLVHHAKGAMP